MQSLVRAHVALSRVLIVVGVAGSKLLLSGSGCVDVVFEVVLTRVLVKRGVMAEHGAPCGGFCCCFPHRGRCEVLVSGLG
ncbi:hypothetical protein [Xylella fastidiosa]|uniref:hypothetical protein n=1 Tax=Xylella fastidiosa TaxID=2371 RepID=UPI003AFADCFC